VVSALALLLPVVAQAQSTGVALSSHIADDAGTPSSVQVPVTLGVMSKCPDANVCETVWDDVLRSVGHLVDLRLVYIGRIDNSTIPPAVSCMHGPTECAGNIQQLCAIKYWGGGTPFQAGKSGIATPVKGNETWRDWWDLVQCMNAGPQSRIGPQELVAACASSIGREWDDDLRACLDGDEGSRLLQQSVDLANELDITRSCTILINNRQVCVHDSDWKECKDGHSVADFERQVRSAWKKLNSHAQQLVVQHPY